MVLELRKLPPGAFPFALESNLRRVGPLHKVYRHFLDALSWHFQADAAWLALRLRRNRKINEKWLVGDGALCDDALLEPFARLERPRIPPNMLLAPLRVHRRVRGIVGVAARHRSFGVGRGRALNRMAALLARELEQRDGILLARTLHRLQNKALGGLDPRDLAYQVLDSLCHITGCDHSALILSHDPGRDLYRVRAEKILWKKTKSRRIGAELALPPIEGLATIELAASPPELSGPLSGSLRPGAAPPTSLLITPLILKKTRIGALAMMNQKRLGFDDYDKEVVGRFLSLLTFCLRQELTAPTDTSRGRTDH